jgi:hypothetical protein
MVRSAPKDSGMSNGHIGSWCFTSAFLEAETMSSLTALVMNRTEDGASRPHLVGVAAWLFALWGRLTASILRCLAGGGMPAIRPPDPAQTARGLLRRILRRAASKDGCAGDGVASHGSSGAGARKARRDSVAEPSLSRSFEDQIDGLPAPPTNCIAEAPRANGTQAHERRSTTPDLTALFAWAKEGGLDERAAVPVHCPDGATRFGSHVPAALAFAEQLSPLSVHGDDRAMDRICPAGRFRYLRSGRGPLRRPTGTPGALEARGGHGVKAVKIFSDAATHDQRRAPDQAIRHVEVVFP